MSFTMFRQTISLKNAFVAALLFVLVWVGQRNVGRPSFRSSVRPSVRSSVRPTFERYILRTV